MMNTPEDPKLTPFIVILPNNRPRKMQAKTENIKNGTPCIKITPPNIFILYKI